jgi:hypothetical protein
LAATEVVTVALLFAGFGSTGLLLLALAVLVSVLPALAVTFTTTAVDRYIRGARRGQAAAS